MVRTQVQLTEKQVEKLRRVASRQRISVAEVIRRAVDKAIEFEYVPDWEELVKRADAVIGSFHSDVTDLSSRHAEYAFEDPE